MAATPSYTIKRIPDTDGDELGLDANYPNPLPSAPTDPQPDVVGSEVPEYEITSGGASETWDPTKPSEGPTLDPISLAKLRLQQLRAAKRIIKRQTRAVQLGQHHVKKVAKGRRKKQLEKASRKRNR